MLSRPATTGRPSPGRRSRPSAALAALEIVSDPDLLASVTAVGERFRAGLEELDGVAEVRGRGLMVAVSLDEGIDAAAVATAALAERLVVNVPGERMLRFLPPLTVGEAEVDEALARLGRALAAAS